MIKTDLIFYKISKRFRRFVSRRAFGFYFGLLISYFVAYFSSGKEVDEKGIIPGIIFDAGELEVHLHHWLISSTLLAFLILPLYLKGKISKPLFLFVTGFALGSIIQGVFSYSDWHEIINKRIPLDNFKLNDFQFPK